MERETESEKKPEVESVSSVILRTALKTLVTVATVGTLIFAVVLGVLPQKAMNLYLDFGNKVRALESAERYLKQYKTETVEYDSEYCGVLYTAFGTAVSLMNSAEESGNRRLTEYYADKVIDLSERYLSVNGVEIKNANIDAYNLKHTVVTLHPSLYGLSDYIKRVNYRARILTGKTDYIPVGVGSEFEVRQLSAVTTQYFMYSSSKDDEVETFYTRNIDTVCCLLYQFADLINHDLAPLGATDSAMSDVDMGKVELDFYKTYFPDFFDRDDGFTILYRRLDMRMDLLREIALKDTADDAVGKLKRIYRLKAISAYCDAAYQMTRVLFANGKYYDASVTFDSEEYFKWSAHGSIGDYVPTESGETIPAGARVPIKQYVRSWLISDYAKAYAAKD